MIVVECAAMGFLCVVMQSGHLTRPWCIQESAVYGLPRPANGLERLGLGD